MLSKFVFEEKFTGTFFWISEITEIPITEIADVEVSIRKCQLCPSIEFISLKVPFVYSSIAPSMFALNPLTFLKRSFKSRGIFVKFHPLTSYVCFTYTVLISNVKITVSEVKIFIFIRKLNYSLFKPNSVFHILNIFKYFKYFYKRKFN